MSRTERFLGLTVVVLLAACSEAGGDAGATTTAAGSGGGSTSTAVGPMAATTTSGAGGNGGSGLGGSEPSGGGTTGQGGCPELPPPEVCNAVGFPEECEGVGCVWVQNVNYVTTFAGECDTSFRDFCLAFDECLAPQFLQGYFLGEDVIQFSGPCGRLQGWTPCSGADTDPPACACTEDELTCE